MTNWQILFSKDSLKFLKRNNLPENQFIYSLSLSVKKLQGENINVDLRKMKGEWAGFFRLRTGKIQIIFKIDFPLKQIYIDRIDYRGDVYK